MTVQQLIEHLKSFPPDQLVVVDGYEGGYNEPHLINQPIMECVEWFEGHWWGQYDEPGTSNGSVPNGARRAN